MYVGVSLLNLKIIGFFNFEFIFVDFLVYVRKNVLVFEYIFICVNICVFMYIFVF